MRRLARAISGLKAAGLLGAAELAGVQAAAQRLWPRVPAVPGPHLTHNDLGVANLKLARRGGRWALAGVFDYERCTAGDPAFEFANLLGDPDPGIDLPALFAGYYELADLGPHLPHRLSLYTLLYHMDLALVAARHRGPGDPSYSLNLAALRAAAAGRSWLQIPVTFYTK